MHTRAHVAASVCARCMHRRGSSIVFHWSRWPRKDGRLRGETRRGEARRSAERRGEARLENGKNGEAGQLHAHARARTLALSCFGPATINERRAKIVLCFHPPILSSRPISALHLPVRRLAFTGMGSIRRLSGFLRAGQDLSINILEPIRGNRGANLMPKETVSDDSLYS